MKRNDPHPGFPRRPPHRRKLYRAVPLLACLVLLAACGGGGEGGSAAPNPDERPAPNPGEPPAPNPGEPPAPNPDERPAPNPDERPAPNPDERPAPNPDERPAPNPDERPAPNPDERPAPNPGGSPVPNPGGLEFRPINLGAPAASDGKNYRTAEYGAHWGLESISAHTAYQRGYFGRNVTIAIADDGIDLTHPDLAGRITAPKRVVQDDERVTEDSRLGVHGTYVAMIAAGARANTGGAFEVTVNHGAPTPTKNIHGVAPSASIMPISLFGGGEPTAAIRHAVANDADVINFSIGISPSHWGSYDGRDGVWLTQSLPLFNPILREGDYDNLRSRFAEAARDLADKDIVAVWAAGNDGWNAVNNRRVSMCGKNSRDEDGCLLGEISVPAAEFMEKYTRDGDTVPFGDLWGADCGSDDCVDYNSGGGWNEAPLFEPGLLGKWLVVAAMDESNEIASFSNGCGAARNWCLMAPGENLEILPGRGLDGTSFAAPMVSGALAVLKSRLPDMPMEVVQALLLDSADPLGTRMDNPREPDPIYGWGRLNLGNAITRQGTVHLPYSVVDRSAGVPLLNAGVTLSPALAHAGEGMRAVEVAAGGVGGAYYNTRLSGIVDVEAPPPSRTSGRAARDMLAPTGGRRIENSVLFAELDEGSDAFRTVGMDLSTGMLGRWRLSRDLCGDCGKPAWREWDASRDSAPVSPPFFDNAGRTVALQMQGDGARPFVAFGGRESRRTPWHQFGLQWRRAYGGFALTAELSRIDESRSVWGSTFGALGNTRTETLRRKLLLSGPLGGDWRGFAGYEHSSGEVSVTGGMLSGISGLRAEGWSMGVEGRNTLRDDDTLRFSVGRKTRSTGGRIRIDHLRATGSGFVDAFYRGHAQSLEQHQAVIDLRARPAMGYSLGYALPVHRGVRLAFGLEYEGEIRSHEISTRLQVNF